MEDIIRIRAELGGHELAYNYALPREFAVALQPLPRDRELGGWDAVAGMHQLDQRRMAAKAIAAQIATALLQMVEMRDPENGYDKVMAGVDEFKAGLRIR
jgi:hypothetical protein